MSRRTREMAEQAARQASEAGRVLQAQRQLPESESVDPRSDEGERPPSRNEPRRLAMEEIEKRDLETKGLAEAPAPKIEIPENLPPPTPEQMLEGGKFSAPDPVVETPVVETTPEVPVVATVKVKVDGEEFDVPQTEVDEAGGIPAYRVQRAMDNRLKKVNEAANQTQRMQQGIIQWLQQQATPQQPQVSPAQFLASKIDVIRYGTPEESAQALQEVLEKSNPRIDQNAITAQAVNKMQQNIAVSEFQREFPDLVSNPLAIKLATALETERLQQMAREGHTPNWSAFYKQIGNEIKSFTGKPSQLAVPVLNAPSTPSPVDKEARKASIVNLPTAASRAEVPKDPKPETREDVLNQMRKTRGFPTG